MQQQRVLVTQYVRFLIISQTVFVPELISVDACTNFLFFSFLFFDYASKTIQIQMRKQTRSNPTVFDGFLCRIYLSDSTAHIKILFKDFASSEINLLASLKYSCNILI